MRWVMQGAVSLLAGAMVFGCAAEEPEAEPLIEDIGQPEEEVEAEASLEFCEGPTTYSYDPANTDFLGAFPDDFYTVKNEKTPTGLRVSFTDDNTGWTADIPQNFRANVFELNDLDGWGTTAGIFLRFSGELGELPTGEASLSSDAVRLIRIEDDGTGTDLAYESQIVDDGTTAVLIPMVPLEPKRRHGVVFTTDATAADGECISPSPTLKDLLTDETKDPALDRLVPGFQALLDATELRADEVSAAVVFTTQSVLDGDLAVMEDVAGTTYEWLEPPTCTEKAEFLQCEGQFVGADYRDNAGVFVDGTPQTSLTYPVSVWLPKTGQGPFPTLIFGHGIGGDRSQGGYFAELTAQLGIAIVGIDAVAHAAHPAGSGGGGQFDVMKFFAIDILSFSIDGLVLRENWRQSAWDKLQLVTLLQDAPDVTGDGEPDIDLDRITYMGVSLGGIMGSEFLALTDRVGAGVFDVCGARLSQILSDSADFGSLVGIAAPGATEGDLVRFFQIAQSLIERGDPANYAPYLFGQRLEGAGERAPNILMQIAIGDTTIPNSTSRYLAQSMGLPQLAPIFDPVPLVQVDEELPVRGNVSPEVTAGLFQFDRVTLQPGAAPSASGHGNTPGSAESITQTIHFLQTRNADGIGEINDPYTVLGTPDL